MLTKTVDIEKLEIGTVLLTFDFNLRIWMKCKTIQIKKYLITLQGIEGILKGFEWTETLECLKDPEYYRMAD